MTDLHAPRRHRSKASHESDYLPAILVVIVALVFGSFAWAKHQERTARQLEINRIEVANAAVRAENERVLAEAAAAAERSRRNWERSQDPYARSFNDNNALQESYRPPEKSVMQRQAEALAIMQQSRSIQRETDRQEYSRSGAGQVVSGNSQKRGLCQQIEAERDRIHARMRQLYTIPEGEYLRQKLRDNHDQRIRFGC